MPVKEADKERLKHFFDEGDPDEIFILEEEIASGSFGAVYKGRHAQNGKYYAVKIITPEEDEVLEDFMVEISVLRRCKNENIVGFYGSWLKGEELFIAMELCEGGAVSDIFQVSQDPLTEEQIALITRETLKAISYLHANGIIHRDIKGANILLTNEGEIKLVDFGVSAELRHPGDRRNTLIGTPYWMAPEVISNKTGNVPYDQKADIWSLGITLLELAERNPPLHEIHPMKALMMIPMRDAPAFSHPEHWTKEFRDFVTLCLIKQPEKRKTADELLKHPFVVNTKGKQVLLELITKRKKLEAKIRAEEEKEGEGEDSSDLDSSDEEVDNLPPAPNVLKSPTTPPQKVAASSKNRNSLPPNEIPPQKGADSPSWQNKKPTNTANRNPMLHQSGSAMENANRDDNSSDGSFLDSPTVQRKQTKDGKETNRPGKGTNRAKGNAPPGNPNRPTYRTNRKLTRREIKNHEKQLIMRNLLKQQLKELRAQQQGHLREQEKQQRGHQKEQEQLTSKFNTQLTNKQKQTAKDLNAMQNKHKTELENYSGNSQRNTKKLQQHHSTLLKSTMKNTETEFKKLYGEFKDKLKEQIKEHKNTLKEKSRSLSKKDVKVLKSEHEFTIGWQDLLFTQKQSRSSLQIEYDKKIQLFQEQEKSENEVLEKRLQIQWEQLELQQQFVADSLHQQHQIESEQLGQQHPLELRHLQEKQELEKLQFSQYLGIEDKQQKFLLSTELKSQLKEFRKIQAKENADLLEQMKQMKKSIVDKKELKQKTDEMKLAHNQKNAKLQAEFTEKQNKQKSEEEEVIRSSQSLRIEQKKQEHEEQIKKLKEEHESQLKKIAESHQQQEKELRERQKKEKQDLLEEQHKYVKDLQRDHHRAHEDMMNEFHNTQRKLLEEHHQEQMNYKGKSPNPQDNDVAKLKLEQDEEKRTLNERQQKDKDAFVVRCEQEQKAMGAELLNQKRKLEEQGRREALFDTSATQVSRTYSEH